MFTPSTPEEHQTIDDEDVPATQEEFRHLRRQLKETSMYVQERWQQQQQLAEDADTWVRVARRAVATARQDVNDTRSDMLAKLREVSDVFRVHRDTAGELRHDLEERNEEWANGIAMKVLEVNGHIVNRVMGRMEPKKIWEDPTHKEYRITVMEEGLAQGRPDADPAPACGDEEADDENDNEVVDAADEIDEDNLPYAAPTLQRRINQSPKL